MGMVVGIPATDPRGYPGGIHLLDHHHCRLHHVWNRVSNGVGRGLWHGLINRSLGNALLDTGSGTILQC